VSLWYRHAASRLLLLMDHTILQMEGSVVGESKVGFLELCNCEQILT